MNSGLCELPATHFSAAAPRSQPPARARARAAALALRRRIWPSRGADLALGYRFRPPLFARARLPAQASYRRWSPICIRHGSSTPHPVVTCVLQTSSTSCSAGSTPYYSRWAEPSAEREPSARPETSSCQRKQKNFPSPALAPKTPPSRPHTSRSPTTDGKTRPRASVPEKKPFSPQKGERRRDRDPTQARARRPRPRPRGAAGGATRATASTSCCAATRR